MNHEYPKIAHELTLLVISILLGYLSWRFIELPFSAKQSTKSKSRTFVSSLAVSGALVLLMIFSLNGLPNRFNEQQLYYSSYMNYSNSGFRTGKCFLTGGYSDITFYNKDECDTFDETKFNILLIGDSHAAHWNSAFSELLNDKQTLTQVTSSGCRPVIPFKGEHYCIDLMEFGMNELIKFHRFNRIILSARWWESDLAKLPSTVEHLKQYSDEVVVIGRTIEYYQYLPRVLATNEISDIKNDNQNKYTELKNLDDDFKKIANENGIKYVSLIDVLCPQGYNACQAVTAESVPIAFDYGHFTHEGALEVGAKLDLLVTRPNLTKRKSVNVDDTE
ncbi:SGNH hydrolase domain-containing protein [Paraglaciecola sp. 20A4]|uniref:SGNH hydrolase domain-containing protein n=1 Tax=Paraglaciecola sp. 20A4 TaxID=2687288 RepID=UPI00140BF222|nr:SGNH hydrolase domain-containing protein [Paraglaciecola sp. 20A4]